MGEWSSPGAKHVVCWAGIFPGVVLAGSAEDDDEASIKGSDGLRDRGREWRKVRKNDMTWADGWVGCGNEQDGQSVSGVNATDVNSERERKNPHPRLLI